MKGLHSLAVPLEPRRCHAAGRDARDAWPHAEGRDHHAVLRKGGVRIHYEEEPRRAMCNRRLRHE